MFEKILVVEDDEFLSDGLREMLEKENYSVSTACSFAEATTLFNDNKYDLVMLDVMLPDGSGFNLCEKIRKTSDVPILFLTACDDELQIVHGLDSGADDYVTKPFGLLELLSRVRSLLRRNARKNNPPLNNPGLNTDNFTFEKNGKSVLLTPIEFQILSKLINNSGIIVTRASLLENIWDNDSNFIDDNTLSVHISRLREKIGANHIVTVRGVGYRWEDGDE